MGRSVITGVVLAAAIAFPAYAASPCTVAKVGEFKVTMQGTQGMVAARINGQDANLLVDSGAFFSSMDPGAKDRLGLKRSIMPPNLIVRGVGGEAQMSAARADNFEVGSFKISNVDFLVGGPNMGSRAAGILGLNILAAADAEFDFANGDLRMFKPQNCDKANLAYWSQGKALSVVPLILGIEGYQNHIISTAKVNGRTIRVVFDTGAATSVLSKSAAEKAGFRPDGPGVTAGGISGGIGRGTNETWIAPFDSFELGGEKIINTRLRVADMELRSVDMLLGADFFLSHRILVARSQKNIYLTYNGGPVFQLQRQPGPRPSELAEAKPLETGPASSAEPTDPDAYARRAAASAARRDFAGAVADLTKAIQLKPTEPTYFYQRATAHQAARQPLMAIADYDEALKLKPDYVLALVNRGEMFLNNRNVARARADFDAAIKAADAVDTIGVRIGADYLRAGMADDAIAEYSAWLAAHPKDDRNPVILAARCYARGLANRELDLAMTDCNAAVRAAPNSATFEDRGLVYLRMGQYDKAIADYDDSLKRQPRNAGPLYGRGLAKIKKGKADEGHADMQAAAAIDPTILARARQFNLVE